YGVELLLKHYTKDWFGLISYTLAKATRVDDPRTWLLHNNPAHDSPNVLHGPRPFDLDQRHKLNIAGSVVLGNWRVGGRLQYVSGVPYSPMMPWGDDFLVQPYAARLPDFFQLDFRADRIWKRCWGTVDLYFDIQNLTNRRAVEGRQIDEDTGMEVDTLGLPILPFIGVEFVPD